MTAPDSPRLCRCADGGEWIPAGLRVPTFKVCVRCLVVLPIEPVPAPVPPPVGAATCSTAFVDGGLPFEKRQDVQVGEPAATAPALIRPVEENE